MTQTQRTIIIAMQSGAVLQAKCVGNLYYLLDGVTVSSKAVKALLAAGTISMQATGTFRLI